jgi:hypothetical protein
MSPDLVAGMVDQLSKNEQVRDRLGRHEVETFAAHIPNSGLRSPRHSTVAVAQEITVPLDQVRRVAAVGSDARNVIMRLLQHALPEQTPPGGSAIRASRRSRLPMPHLDPSTTRVIPFASTAPARPCWTSSPTGSTGSGRLAQKIRPARHWPWPLRPCPQGGSCGSRCPTTPAPRAGERGHVEGAPTWGNAARDPWRIPADGVRLELRPASVTRSPG